MLIVGAGAPGSFKKPQYQIVAYSLNAPAGGAKTQTPPKNAGTGASANAGSSASVRGTAVQVKGGEFFFRLSTKSIAKPGKLTFVFKNIGHNQFDWSWERSLDGGRTWEVLWPIHYKRKG